MNMTQYKKMYGTNFDDEDAIMKVAKGWKDLALKAQNERDECIKALKLLTLTVLSFLPFQNASGNLDAAIDNANRVIAKLSKL